MKPVEDGLLGGARRQDVADADHLAAERRRQLGEQGVVRQVALREHDDNPSSSEAPGVNRQLGHHAVLPLYNDAGGDLECDNAWVVLTNVTYEYDVEGDHVEQPWSRECLSEAAKTWGSTKPWLVIGTASAVIGGGLLAKRRWDRLGVTEPLVGD